MGIRKWPQVFLHGCKIRKLRVAFGFFTSDSLQKRVSDDAESIWKVACARSFLMGSV